MIDFFHLPESLDFILDELLLALAAIVMMVTCMRLILSKSLTESVIVMSVFSLFIGICYLFMDAPDVAMTETALGACLSTCVLLNLVNVVGNEFGTLQKSKLILAALLCIIFIGYLSWASLDLPKFGDNDAPIQTHLTRYFVENTSTEIGIPSFVAAILASYRGFDTLGETTVILIAGIAVLAIVARNKRGDDA